MQNLTDVANLLNQESSTWCPRATDRREGPRGSPASLFW